MEPVARVARGDLQLSLLRDTLIYIYIYGGPYYFLGKGRRRDTCCNAADYRSSDRHIQ